jgi:hypothetical protein
MTDHTTAERIRAFATHCGRADTAPETTARNRGWLDAEGNPTPEGDHLVRALDEQDATRSVFRTVL